MKSHVCFGQYQPAHTFRKCIKIPFSTAHGIHTDPKKKLPMCLSAVAVLLQKKRKCQTYTYPTYIRANNYVSVKTNLNSNESI